MHPTQSEVFVDQHRFRIVCAGRRWGKSVLARTIILTWALEKPGLYWIVSPTYKQSKMIHWREMQGEIPPELVAKKNEVELSCTLKNGSIIVLKGADSPDALRGIGLRGLVVDEIASIRSWDWLWSEVLRPALTDYEAPVIFISTPKGYNHFYELFELGQKEGNYKSWRFTSYQNPHIPKREIDLAEKDLTEDTFAQEYMADFRKATGIAHKEWDRDIHFIEPFDIPTEWQRGRGFDYGLVHFTASVRIVIDDDDNWFIDNCYLDNRRDVKGHAEAIKAQDYGFPFVPCWGDPTGKQWVAEFGMHNLHIQNANKMVGQGFRGWVEFCVEKVNGRLKSIPGHTVYLPNGKKIKNAPRLFVLKNGKTDKFVSQVEALCWRETATGDIVPVLDEDGDPTGGHFDLMAAFRYFAVSYAKPTGARLPPNDISQKDWRIGK